jgi:histone H3/H4
VGGDDDDDDDDEEEEEDGGGYNVTNDGNIDGDDEDGDDDDEEGDDGGEDDDGDDDGDDNEGDEEEETNVAETEATEEDAAESAADKVPSSTKSSDALASTSLKKRPVALSTQSAAVPSDSGDGIDGSPKKKKRVGRKPPSATKSSTNLVTGLSIPFRTIKKAMKLDPDILIVQNEAALVVTKAAEMFLENLAMESLKISKNHGRNTIRYEDVAEARSNDASKAFLKTILP